jgi:transposase
MDRKRKKKTSNEDWQSPVDGDAEITKLKDGRTALAYKAENAVTWNRCHRCRDHV